MRNLYACATLACITLLCGRTAAAQLRVVTVTGGQVEGVSADGITSFKGVPFAASPVGQLRWRAPQPMKPWTGIKAADHFAPGCIQKPDVAKIFAAPLLVSEDCLYLNVWTPARSASEKLPVMVWIYGGGFSVGQTSAPAYDGAHLAHRGIVLVSIAYRLGAFGFLADPDLSREPGGGSGNYGILDMIQGLQWVKANIAKFGGDSTNVTIFGESAGGIAVSILAACPAAHGLFQRVISESGSNFSPVRSSPLGTSAEHGQEIGGLIDRQGGEIVQTLASAERYDVHFLERLGARSIGAARQLPAAVIQKAAEMEPAFAFLPVVDGRILLGDEHTLYPQRRFNDTPILLGTNADEGILFVQPGITSAIFERDVRSDYGRYADAIIAAYPHATDALAEQAARDLLRDTVFAWGTWSWAQSQMRYGRNKAYLYYFDDRSPQAALGPSHAAEIGYVFGNLNSCKQCGSLGLNGLPGPAELTLSELIQSYWINFAKTGDPNGPGLPAWPEVTSTTQEAMFLDVHPGAHPVPNLRQIKVLDAYFAWRRRHDAQRP
jgi:para-nitrobenzyl esterase